MARAAFITDRLLRKFGLSGRSFIPMLMGFGCTTTAIIAARGVENERDRRMTILAHAVHELRRSAAGLRAVHGGVFPKEPNAGGAEPIRAGNADDDRLRSDSAQDSV